MSARPAGMTIRLPSRPARTVDTGDTAAMANAKGSARTPAESGLYPCTSWRYWVRTNRLPNRAKKVTVTAAAAAEKARTANTRRSMSGLGMCSSHQVNRPSTASSGGESRPA